MIPVRSDIPRTDLYRFRVEEGERILEFRLIYRGQLSSESSRPHPQEKHHIRKVFHKQLVELWHQTPCLLEQIERPVTVHTTPENLVSYPGPGVTEVLWAPKDSGAKPWVERLADEYARHGFRFVPLVREENGFSCALNILFLRRDNPGNLVRSGGDIDNRIKVLFDALRIADNLSELAGAVPEAGEDPFFCLLEDDSLITEVAVTTDRLLTPLETSESINDVHLVIHVKLSDPSGVFLHGRVV